MVPGEEQSSFLSAFGLDSVAKPGHRMGSGSRAGSPSEPKSSVTPDIAAYLTQLSSYGLERLNREPERLSEERAAVLDQTKQLASRNYKTFIKTAECSKEIFDDFVGVEHRLDTLLNQKLPSCTESCKEFQVQAESISVKRKVNSQILQRHSQLLELLEVPQLIDACVKNGHFDDALELANFVRKVNKKHGASIPLVRSILCEVRDCIQSMISQLIGQLRTAQLSLPVCLKVIGHIRRLDAFTETELRVLFLNARDSWFKATLASIPSDDAYNHVTKTIDTTRVHLFDIVTQYKAIFNDDNDLVTVRRGTPVASRPNDSAILHSWILEKVEGLLSTLKKDLYSPAVIQRLDAVLNQAMYLGLSFGRVGIDIRALLIPIFEETSLRILSSAVDQAAKTFEDELKVLSFSSTAVTASSSNTVLAMSFDVAAKPDYGQLVPPPPPLTLLQFPPLASLYNNFINGLNDMRPTATLTSLYPVKDVIDKHFILIANILIATFNSFKNTFTEGETSNFMKLCLLFLESFIPNVVKCFKCLYPSQQLAEALGIGIGSVHKSNCYSFDLRKIYSIFDNENFPEIAAMMQEKSELRVKESGIEELEDKSDLIEKSENSENRKCENRTDEIAEVEQAGVEVACVQSELDAEENAKTETFVLPTMSIVDLPTDDLVIQNQVALTLNSAVDVAAALDALVHKVSEAIPDIDNLSAKLELPKS